jgi:diacylglycerol kinase family enzyme
VGDLQPGVQRGSHEPEELHRELEGYDLEWITTGSPGDAREAAREWRDGLLIVVGGDGTISEVVNGLGRAGFPEDGLLDLVIIEDVGAWEVLKLAPTVLADSDYLDIEGVFFARARKIRVETPSRGLEFTVDGEIIGDEPAEFSMIPQALKVVVGPGYVPEP